MNQTQIVGRIGKVGELRYTQGGKAVLNFTVATDNGKDESGEKRQPDWFEIALWENQAENLAEYLKVGGLVGVTGQVKLKVDEGKDGEKYPKLTIAFPRVELLGDKRNSEDAPATKTATKTASKAPF